MQIYKSNKKSAQYYNSVIIEIKGERNLICF